MVAIDIQVPGNLVGDPRQLNIRLRAVKLLQRARPNVGVPSHAGRGRHDPQRSHKVATLSPTAVRAALMRLVNVDSEMIRSPQTEPIR